VRYTLYTIKTFCMTNLYSKYPSCEMNYLKPKKESIEFLLNYSKALKITKYNEIEFETLLN